MNLTNAVCSLLQFTGDLLNAAGTSLHAIADWIEEQL